MRIFQDLIAGCTTSCQLSHRLAKSFGVGSCVSLNPGIKMSGRYGFVFRRFS